MRDCHRDAKTKAYSALVRPILEYSAPVWAPHKQQHVNALEKVQKRAARWAIGAKWNRQLNCCSSLYLEPCHDLQWLTLQQRHLLLCQCQAFKIVHGIDCINFLIFFAFKRRSLRSHPYSFSIPKSRNYIPRLLMGRCELYTHLNIAHVLQRDIHNHSNK